MFNFSSLSSLINSDCKRILVAKLPYILSLLTLLLCILTSAYISWGYSSRPHLGVVNITGLVDEFITSQAKNNATPEVLKHNVKAFGQMLEIRMRELSQKYQLVLLPAEAVITGAKDYTQEVRSLLPALKVSTPAVLK